MLLIKAYKDSLWWSSTFQLWPISTTPSPHISAGMLELYGGDIKGKAWAGPRPSRPIMQLPHGSTAVTHTSQTITQVITLFFISHLCNIQWFSHILVLQRGCAQSTVWMWLQVHFLQQVTCLVFVLLGQSSSVQVTVQQLHLSLVTKTNPCSKIHKQHPDKAQFKSNQSSEPTAHRPTLGPAAVWLMAAPLQEHKLRPRQEHVSESVQRSQPHGGHMLCGSP